MNYFTYLVFGTFISVPFIMYIIYRMFDTRVQRRIRSLKMIISIFSPNNSSSVTYKQVMVLALRIASNFALYMQSPQLATLILRISEKLIPNSKKSKIELPHQSIFIASLMNTNHFIIDQKSFMIDTKKEFYPATAYDHYYLHILKNHSNLIDEKDFHVLSFNYKLIPIVIIPAFLMTKVTNIEQLMNSTVNEEVNQYFQGKLLKYMQYMQKLIQVLENYGYKKNINLVVYHGQPLDFECILLSHSMGSIDAHYLACTNKNIKKWIGICPVFGGTAIATREFIFKNHPLNRVGEKPWYEYHILDQRFWNRECLSGTFNEELKQEYEKIKEAHKLKNYNHQNVPKCDTTLMCGICVATEIGYILNDKNEIVHIEAQSNGDGFAPYSSIHLHRKVWDKEVKFIDFPDVRHFSSIDNNDVITKVIEELDSFYGDKVNK